MAAPVLNESASLQIPQNNSHAGAPDAKHLREELVRNFKLITFDAIVRHQEPAATAFLDRVMPIAGGQLCQLREKGVGVKMECFREWTAVPRFLPQHRGLHSQRSPG